MYIRTLYSRFLYCLNLLVVGVIYGRSLRQLFFWECTKSTPHFRRIHGEKKSNRCNCRHFYLIVKRRLKTMVQFSYLFTWDNYQTILLAAEIDLPFPVDRKFWTWCKVGCLENSISQTTVDWRRLSVAEVMMFAHKHDLLLQWNHFQDSFWGWIHRWQWLVCVASRFCGLRHAPSSWRWASRTSYLILCLHYSSFRGWMFILELRDFLRKLVK